VHLSHAYRKLEISSRAQLDTPLVVEELELSEAQRR
jgi:hypothetical protein